MAAFSIQHFSQKMGNKK